MVNWSIGSIIFLFLMDWVKEKDAAEIILHMIMIVIMIIA